MFRRLLILLFSLVSAVCLVLVLLIPLLGLFRASPLIINLPAGLQVCADSSTRCLTLTRFLAETRKWWLAIRKNNERMTVRAHSITLEESPGWQLHAARLDVVLPERTFAGLTIRCGAISKDPFTALAGVMSTPLVPYRSIIIPWYYLLPFVLIPPALFLPGRLRRRHRIKHNLCLTCGYDLRASRDKCPECGSPIPNSKSKNRKPEIP